MSINFVHLFLRNIFYFREWNRQKVLKRDPEDVLLHFSSSEYYPW